MLEIAHNLLMLAYFVLPPAMLIAIFIVPRRRYSRVLPNATVAIATSLVLGISASIIYDVCFGGIVTPLQMLLTSYWGAGLICILKILDLVLDKLARFAFKPIGSLTPVERQSAAQVVRVILLFSIGLPYMVAAATTYRPKFIQRIAPRPILFIHGLRDPLITFEFGQRLYDAAGAPKGHIWLENLTDEQAVDDPGVIRQTRHFLDTAIPML